MTSEKLSLIRTGMFAVTGLVCAAYAGMAILGNTPNPFGPWIPGVLGFGTGVMILLATLAAGRKATAQAMDEGYRADSQRAQQVGYWVALWMYPVFAVFLWQELLDWPTAFAAMGTLTGAAYLLPAVWFELRGRV